MMNLDSGELSTTMRDGRQTRSNILRQSLGLQFLAIFMALSSPTAANATTSDDVLRAINDLIAEVRLLHDANLSIASTKKLHRSEELRPRHALQMANSVLKKANTLAWLNGAETITPGPMPTRKVTSADVLANIQAIVWVIEGLRPVFGVETTVVPSLAREDTTTNYVYAALHQLSEMIDSLGNPRTVPNDIYRIADSIVLELEILGRHYPGQQFTSNIDGTWNRSQKPEGDTKTLRDIYRTAFALAKSLERLIRSRPELAPLGGILKPYRRHGIVNADHVSYALNDVLADVVAIKSRTGDLSPAPLKPSASGMTPTHVYLRLQDALAIVDALAFRG